MKRELLLTAIVLLGLWWLVSGRTIQGFEGTPDQRCKYLEDMVKYLTIVIRMQNARRELYFPVGFGSPPQSFTSPKLTALEKQRQFFIDKVKKDPQELAFFRENLTFTL